MRRAPRLRGGLGVRVPSLFCGLVLLAVAIVSLLESGLGLAPWDVLHVGIAEHSPLTIGTTTIVVGFVVLSVAWALGQAPGFGTVANAIVVGATVDGLLAIGWVSGLSERGFAERVSAMIVGVALFGFGIALYIAAGMGAGPRDSLMLVLARRTGVRIAAVRVSLDTAALVTGWFLGGTVGIGTLAIAILLGPSIEGSFRLLTRLGLATPAPAEDVAIVPPAD
ncbi:MAG TPA: membrane protein [Actinomycetota bacterium]|nr:membrane protein [Actinomycetota bacterium]